MERIPQGKYTPEFRAGAVKLVEIGKGQRIPTELEVELSRMRKELAEVKMERDLLKKFATYFAKESR